MDNPWLSIIIPVYNPPLDLFDNCIKSLSGITAPTEILLIDDGSNKKTQEFCGKLVVSDNRIRYVRQGNQGVSCARTKGIGEAKGEYIFFLDSDDAVPADWCAFISSYYGTIEEDWILFDVVDYRPESDNFSVRNIFQESIKNISIEELFKYIFGSSKLSECWGKLVSKDLLVKNNISFPEGVAQGEDKIFNYRIIRVAEKVSVYAVPSYIYRYELKNTARLLKNPEKYFNDLKVAFEEGEVTIRKITNPESYKSLLLKHKSAYINEIGSDVIKLIALKKWTSFEKQMVNEFILNTGIIRTICCISVKNKKAKMYYLLLKYKLWWLFKLLSIFKSM